MLCRRIAVLIVLLLAGMLHTAHAESVRIGAGAGYKRLLTELNTAFTTQTGVAVEEIYGHMGHVTTQAKESGRIDIVFGDLDFLQHVPGLTVERYLDIGQGRLVVAWAVGVPMEKPADLLLPGIHRIALADTKNAIFGKAGMEFLTRSGMLETLRPRLMEVSTVPQVTAYLMSGEVQAGCINITDALGIRDKIGGFAVVDQALYTPISIVGAVLPGAAGKPGVTRYLEFLRSSTAKGLVEKYGL